MYCTNKLLLLVSTLGFICIARVFCLTPVARNKRVPHRTSNDIYMDPCKANAFFGDISLADEDLNSFSVISKNSSNSTDDSLYEMQVEDPKAGVLTSKGFSEKTIHVDMRQNERNTHKSKRNKNKKRKLKKHKCPKPHIRCPKRDKECKKQRRLERLKCKKSRKHRVSRRKNKVKTDRAKGQKRPKRAATARPERLWEFGVIPYEIEANFSGQHKALFKLAMRHWENYTCVSFVEKQPEHVNYIVFTERPCGCCSFVGKRGSGAQAISIGKNCDKFGIVVHELGHVIGFWHEHTRPDRDDHVIIVKKNIMPGQEYNFNKLTESEVNSLGEEYDYGSIMHYATNTFARATYVDTILPRRKLEMIPLPEIGQRVRLSPGDIQQANKLYRCPTCGRTLQDSNAEFSYTPSESGNRVCQWRISATHGEKIVLNISSLDIPETTGCESDYLEIRDGHFIKSPLLGRLCGKSLPTTLISSDSRMWLEFKSSRGQGKGFSAQYEAICGGEITRENGRLTSPNYPDDYKANKECVWKITVEEGYSVALKFQSFEIENHDNCVYDYLEVRDGHEDNSPLIGKFCGYKIPEDIKSTGNRLYVKFFSDGSVQKAGFAASFVKENDECSTDTHGCEHFCVNTLGSFKCECRIGFELHSDGKKCEDACGGYIDHRNGTIQSPSFPDLYPANKMCVWQIVAPDQYRITLNMTHFDLEGNNQDCEYDYVRVSSGSEARPEIHGIFCGSTLPLPVTSESNMLRIEFNSDNSVQKTGFQAQFFTDMDECAFNNGECQHICKNTVGSYECACHNGYTLHENRHDCKEGGCQHTITDAVGEISSPNWPDYYPSRKDCAWHFSTTKGHRIRLTFTHFGLEPHQDCTYDHIEIFDGNSVNARSLGKFCGSSIPPPKTSTSNVMFMVFYSDASVQRKGFKATHKTVCGGQLDAEDSPNQLYSHAKYGDQNYDNKVECEWIITAPRRRKVKFYFVTFEIEDESECGYDNVEIYNGMQDSDPLIGRFCGSKVPHEIISDGPHLMVRFKSDDTINWKGFSAVYVAFQEEDPDGGATKESSTES